MDEVQNVGSESQSMGLGKLAVAAIIAVSTGLGYILGRRASGSELSSDLKEIREEVKDLQEALEKAEKAKGEAH